LIKKIQPWYKELKGLFFGFSCVCFDLLLINLCAFDSEMKRVVDVFCFCSQYLSELLAEHQKLGPFLQVLPICSRLLNQGLFMFKFVDLFF